MYQIDDREIKNKDFSMKLPWLIDRIISVSEALAQPDKGLELTDSAIRGFGFILDDIAGQLFIINDSLYGSERDIEQPETAT